MTYLLQHKLYFYILEEQVNAQAKTDEEKQWVMARSNLMPSKEGAKHDYIWKVYQNKSTGLFKDKIVQDKDKKKEVRNVKLCSIPVYVEEEGEPKED